MVERDDAALRSPRTVGIREFRGNFSGLMRQVRAGSSFIVTSRDEVVAVIQPPQPSPISRRRPGTLRGKVVLAPDFDIMSSELSAAMEGEGE